MQVKHLCPLLIRSQIRLKNDPNTTFHRADGSSYFQKIINKLKNNDINYYLDKIQSESSFDASKESEELTDFKLLIATFELPKLKIQII